MDSIGIWIAAIASLVGAVVAVKTYRREIRELHPLLRLRDVQLVKDHPNYATAELVADIDDSLLAHVVRIKLVKPWGCKLALGKLMDGAVPWEGRFRFAAPVDHEFSTARLVVDEKLEPETLHYLRNGLSYRDGGLHLRLMVQLPARRRGGGWAGQSLQLRVWSITEVGRMRARRQRVVARILAAKD